MNDGTPGDGPMTTPTLSEGLAHAANEVAAGVGGPVGSLMLAAWSVRAAALESERDALRAEVARLREALRKYGDHTHDCPEHIANVMTAQGGECACGFDESAMTGEKR